MRLLINEAVPHGFSIIATSGATVLESEVFGGPSLNIVAIPALAAGRYTFQDPVHPNMSGTLHVGQIEPEPGAVATPAPTDTPPDPPTTAPVAAVPVGSGGAGDTPAVELAAANLTFDVEAAMAPADEPFTIRLVNRDATVPHGLAIMDAAGSVEFQGEVVTGPADVTYAAPSLRAGSYTFSCPVHPTMSGTLIVGSHRPTATASPAGTPAPVASPMPSVVITTEGTRFVPATSTIATGPFRLGSVNDAWRHAMASTSSTLPGRSSSAWGRSMPRAR